jgi:hypothetical protein
MIYCAESVSLYNIKQSIASLECVKKTGVECVLKSNEKVCALLFYERYCVMFEPSLIFVTAVLHTYVEYTCIYLSEKTCNDLYGKSHLYCTVQV